MTHTIMIIEDDAPLRQGLVGALSADEFIITAADSLAAARNQLHTAAPELVLLDYNLPDGSGIELCPELSARGIQVIFLTVRDSEIDEVTALKSGAVDYIKKPFSLMVLRERIRSALRRAEAGAEYCDERYSFNFSRIEFYMDGLPLELSRSEQRLLQTLVEHARRIVTRETLIERLWSCDSDFIDENALSVTVRRLRTKLGAECIRTVYGLGYMWVGA